MRNAARQRADRLHLLRLAQLCFELLLVGLRLLLCSHIARGTDKSQRLARGVAQTAASRGYPMPNTVRVTNTILAFIASRAPLEVIIDGALEARQVVRMNRKSRQPFG